MTPEELDDLAHEIAEEECKSFIDAQTINVKDSQGNTWHDLDSAKSETARYHNLEIASSDRETAEGAAWYLNRAETYLEAAEILKRSPENPRWVSWDEDDTLSEAANV